MSERLLPKRPALGFLFASATAAWVCVFCVEQFSWGSYAASLSPEEPAGVPGAVAIVTVSLVAVVLLVMRRRARVCVNAVALVLVSVCAAGVCAGLFWQAWESDIARAQEALSGGSVTIELTSDAAERDYGFVSEGKLHAEGGTTEVRVMWPEGTTALSAGHAITASGSLKVPDASEGGRWNHQNGFVGMVKVASFEDAGYAGGLQGAAAPFRDASFARIEQLGGDAAGLLAGVLIGNKTLYAGTELEQAFRTTGLAHLMAVSGTHLAVVAVLAGFVLARLPLRKGVKSLSLVGLLVAYTALTAFAPSALRSCVMCAVGLQAPVFSRRLHVGTALAACVMAFLCLDPSLAFSVGFQLSVLSVLGLVVLSPLASAWLRTLLPQRLEGVADALSATFTASVLTLPVTIPLFSQLPLVSPLANIVAGPLITAVLGLGISALLLAAVVPPLGALLLELAGAVAQICAWAVQLLADIPAACVPLDASAPWLSALCIVGIIALYAIWPLPRQADAASPRLLRARLARRAAPVAVFLLPVAVLAVAELGGLSGAANTAGTALSTTFVASDAQVVMLDVGQGDAMLIRDGDAAVLVDTGEEGTVLQAALARQGITRLDAVILTHKDADHTGALSSLAGVVVIGHVFVHEGLQEVDDAQNVVEACKWVTGATPEGLVPGDKVKAGRFALEVLAPQECGEGGNEDSLIQLLTFDADADGNPESSGLLTGDGESAEVAPVLEACGDVDFAKVGHHGSKGAFTAEELASLKPELALISVGADNTYGHPTQETLGLLVDAGAEVRRTDLCGDITLSFSARSVSVRTQKGV